MVACPDAGGKSVTDIVCPGQALFNVAEPLNGDHRPENLILDHLVILTQAGDHGRLMEEAAGANSSTTRDDLGVARRTCEEALHARELGRIVERPECRVLNGQVT